MDDLLSEYLFAKRLVISHGYDKEILWQLSTSFDELDESIFLRELAWVILSSGMREAIIRRIFKDISACFFNWTSARCIVVNKEACFEKAIKYFNNKPKINAVICGAHKINNEDFVDFKDRIYKNPLDTLQEFPYIGPVTVYHLAKNIGLPVAKPDRHLIRIARNFGFNDVQLLCRHISELSGDSIPVVDIVLWRYAVISNDGHISFTP
jgi:hypothetical protein